MDIKKIALFAAGTLFGSAGFKLLSSKDAKKVYTQTIAAVLRMKELWFYFGNLFENSEKLQKSIKKAKNAEEFERAAAALFCSCEVRENVVPAWFRPA